MIRGLKNIGSSCYMDSVLFSLFAVQNCYIDKYIDNNKNKNIQKEIRKIVVSIRSGKGVEHCSDLRKELTDFWEHGQQEAGEFLIYFFSLFNAAHSTKITNSYATNSLAQRVSNHNLVPIDHTIDRLASNIQFISSFNLRELSDDYIYSIRLFLKITEDSGQLTRDNLCKYKGSVYKRRIEVMELFDSPYLIFYFQRADPVSGQVLEASIKPSKSITLSSERKLKLRSIVVHMGGINIGHYISYIRMESEWYMYC